MVWDSPLIIRDFIALKSNKNYTEKELTTWTTNQKKTFIHSQQKVMKLPAKKYTYPYNHHHHHHHHHFTTNNIIKRNQRARSRPWPPYSETEWGPECLCKINLQEVNQCSKDVPQHSNENLSHLWYLSPGMPVNTRYINSTRGTSPSSESYCKWLGCLLLCLCDISRMLITSLVCWRWSTQTVDCRPR